MQGQLQRERLAISSILGLYAILVVRFWFVCDDAFISFRYARNLALGHGLAFNPTDWPPVEGYSNLLWVLGAALFELIGLAPATFMPVISAGCGAVLLLKTYRMLIEHLGVSQAWAWAGTLTLAASPAIGVWATSGLATMPAALLILLLAERWWFRERTEANEWWVDAALAITLMLLRTEGLGWVGVVAGASLVMRAVDRQPLEPQLRRLARPLGGLAGVWLVYTAWRVQHYGTWVPNVALAKVAPGPASLLRGLKYVLLFWLTCLVPAISLLGARPLLRGPDPGRWAAVGLLAVAFPVYSVVVGGDFMPFGRLLVPGLPFAAMLLAGGLQSLRLQDQWRLVVPGALVVLYLLPVLDVHVVPEAIRRVFHFRLSDKMYLSEANRWANQAENSDGFSLRGRALAQIATPSDAVVAGAVGAVGYFSGLEVLDQHGLVTKEVAYRPTPPGPLSTSPGHDKHVKPEFFVKYEPRFLYARAVQGHLAAGRMKDALDQWNVQLGVMDRYVPDYFEVELPGETERTFLFTVRRRLDHEDPAQLWNEFPSRRRSLNAELRAQAEGAAAQ